MENTTTNRQLLNRLQALCEGTPYELRIRERENSIGLSFYTCADAPEYTPYMCVEDEVCFTESFRIAVQTTSYGALPPEDILQVAQGLMTAAQLAKAMRSEIQLAGYRVIGD